MDSLLPISKFIDYLLARLEENYEKTGLSISDDLTSWGNTLRLRLAGTKEMQLFLKEKVFYLSSDEFPIHLFLHRHVMKSGVPVAPLLTTKSGAISFKVCKREFEVQQWLQGDSCRIEQPAYILSLGHTFGVFHCAASHFRLDQMQNWSFPSARRRWFPDHWELICSYLDFLQSLHTNQRSILTQLRDIREQLVYWEEIIEWDKLPKQWLHGDASPDNAIWQGSAHCYLLDFDDARWGYKSWEVAQMVTVLGIVERNKENGLTEIRKNWDSEKMAQFLSGYLEVNRLTDSELRAFASLLALNCLIVGISEIGFDEEQIGRSDLIEQFEHITVLIKSIPEF
ncbi:MAG: phosphotransferase [Acidobacteria bacterium]|nr:phosphotransferase [Acidobacteriota bacterium]